MDDLCVVGGPASQSLSLNIATELRARVLKVESKVFPDGESYVRVPDEFVPKYTVLVQSTHPPQDRHIMQLCFLAQRLKELGTRVIAVVPYLAYSRQHRSFLPGECVSLRVLAKLLEAADISRMITIDIHNVEGLGYFSIPANSLSAVRDIAAYLKGSGKGADCLVVSPDEGARIRAETLALQLGSEYAVASKQRNRVTGEVTVTLPEGAEIKEKEVVVIDDAVSTGGTIAGITRAIKKRGAKKVTVACTHALLATGAIERMTASGVDEFVSTDTAPGEFSKVSVAHTVSEFIRRL
ncbi:MAG: ribose-phosphate pyrophosphokinase [Nitrososphaerota archaeon]|nr:ribose-phosphate pyrophosphokinase [Nitrososphaerota archaeon]MDG6939422.1 ribose-phosphate pyrophosphokinase [Nitrososphaerota archaeon]